MPDSEAFDETGPDISSLAQQRNQPPRPCILIADDEADLRIILADYLAHHGYEIAVAADGREALALATARRPDLALVDVRMPGPSGMDLTAQLKALHPDLPVVIITAYGSIEDAAEAIRSGALHYLPKPLQMGRVLAVVEEALDESKAQTQQGNKPTSLDPLSLEEQARVESLSQRQRQVWVLLGQGLTNQQIAAQLDISAKTVDHHVHAVLNKLALANRIQAALVAQRCGMANRA
jgi:DNA-binding NarL/FixJ family response regulator